MTKQRHLHVTAVRLWSLIVTLDVSPTVFEILMLKARKWLIFRTPPLFDAPARGNPLEFLDESETFFAKTRVMGYRMVKISLS